MKSSFFTLLAVPAFIYSVVASPTEGSSLAARGKVLDDYVIISRLYSEAEKHDATINKTFASMTSASTAEQNATSTAVIEGQLKDLIAEVDTAKKQVKEVSAKSLGKRESGEEQLEQEISKLVTEIGITLEKITSSSQLLGDVGTLEDRLLGALVALGGPLSSAVPNAVTLITGILSKILGSV